MSSLGLRMRLQLLQSARETLSNQDRLPKMPLVPLLPIDLLRILNTVTIVQCGCSVNGSRFVNATRIDSS